MTERPKIPSLYGKCPCYGCDERNAECHSTCQKYKEFTKRVEETRHRIKQERMAERYQTNRIAVARLYQTLEQRRRDR